MNSVVPSGAACATYSAPTAPLAPARFSTMTFCPSRPLSLSARSRATKSVGPPAGKATTMRMVRDVSSCARPAAGANNASANKKQGVARRTLFRFRMSLSENRYPLFRNMRPASLGLDADARDELLHSGNFGRDACRQLLRRAGHHFESGIVRLLQRFRGPQCGLAFLGKGGEDRRRRAGGRKQRVERVGDKTRIAGLDHRGDIRQREPAL